MHRVDHTILGNAILFPKPMNGELKDNGGIPKDKNEGWDDGLFRGLGKLRRSLWKVELHLASLLYSGSTVLIRNTLLSGLRLVHCNITVRKANRIVTSVMKKCFRLAHGEFVEKISYCRMSPILLHNTMTPKFNRHPAMCLHVYVPVRYEHSLGPVKREYRGTRCDFRKHSPGLLVQIPKNNLPNILSQQ